MVVKREISEEDGLSECDLQTRKYVKRGRHLHECKENKNNSSKFGRPVSIDSDLDKLKNTVVEYELVLSNN